MNSTSNVNLYSNIYFSGPNAKRRLHVHSNFRHQMSHASHKRSRESFHFAFGALQNKPITTIADALHTTYFAIFYLTENNLRVIDICERVGRLSGTERPRQETNYMFVMFTLKLKILSNTIIPILATNFCYGLQPYFTIELRLLDAILKC
jgi:hypothetical protein